jgi:excisionase family DNA binding protein
MEPLLTTDEVAAILRVDVTTVRRMVQRKELDAYRVAGEFRFSTELLTVYLRRQQVSRLTTAPGDGSPFGQLAPETQAIFAHAQQEALDLGHERLGTEHLLLAALTQDSEPPAQILLSAGLHVDTIRGRIQAQRQFAAAANVRCPPDKFPTPMTVQPNVKQALWRAAQAHPGSLIFPQQLLLAIFVDADAEATRLILDAGVHLDELIGHLRAMPI